MASANAPLAEKLDFSAFDPSEQSSEQLELPAQAKQLEGLKGLLSEAAVYLGDYEGLKIWAMTNTAGDFCLVLAPGKDSVDGTCQAAEGFKRQGQAYRSLTPDAAYELYVLPDSALVERASVQDNIRVFDPLATESVAEKSFRTVLGFEPVSLPPIQPSDIPPQLH